MDHLFRSLAQTSIKTVMKCHDFISKNQAIPIINSDTTPPGAGNASLKMVMNEVFLSFKIRRGTLIEIEKLAAINNCIKTMVFIHKMKALQASEAKKLTTILKEYII